MQQSDRPLETGEVQGLYSRTYRILENLYDNSPVLYCTVNEKGIILDCNETYARRIGYSRSESLGTSVFSHVGPNSLVSMQEYLEIWQKVGRIVNLEVWLQRKDGEIFPALMSAASLHDECGNIVGCNIAIIDQTDIYKTKRDIEKANEELRVREQLKNEFIAIASHELRTPIQPLLGYAVLAKKGKVTNEAAWEGVLKEARRLQQLANDILDVSRIESGGLTYRMEKVDINSLLENVVGSARANVTADVLIELIVDEASKKLEVDLDRSRMTQVLSNLVNNAIKFTGKGSIKIDCHAFGGKNKIEIQVSDTGTGISDKVMPNLFGKFVTRSHGEANGQAGTGLGLFISKAIVAAHKGEIYGHNNATGGATFTIVLPIDHSNIMQH